MISSSRHDLSHSIPALIGEVVKIPGILFVMSNGPQAIMEAWVDSGEKEATVRDGWLSLECKSWHCHLDLKEIVEIRFIEAPDVHDQTRQSFSVRLLGKNEEP